MLVFVAPVPRENGSYEMFSHLFAVVGGSNPVFLSDYVVGKKTEEENPGGGTYPSSYSVWSISSQGDSLVVQHKFFSDPNTEQQESFRITWKKLEEAVRAAGASQPLVTTPLGNFRRAPAGPARAN